MAQIVRAELANILGGIADILPLHVDRLEAASSDDLFLCALGFEPRCLTLPDQLQNAGYKARRAVYFKYATNIDDNDINLPALEGHLRKLASKPQPMEADAEDFPGQFRALLDLIMTEATVKPPRVTLDISVTANRLLMRCMKILLEYEISLRIIYSEAGIYHPTKKEYELEGEKWDTGKAFGLDRGVRQVIPSFDHPGNALDPLPDFVVLFPSFKRERSKGVISFVDPSLLTSPGDKVVWLLGVPHLAENKWRLNAMKTINEIGQGAPQYEVGTFNYKDTLCVLERLHLERSETHTITLSPLGSKMQALGTALFCYIHPDVRIILSMPKEYNAMQYSEGCKDLWRIDFGSLKELRQKLDGSELCGLRND